MREAAGFLTMQKRAWASYGSALVAILSGAAHGQDTIVLREGTGPEWQLSSLETKCGDRKVRFDIVNRNHEPSYLAGAYVDGSALDVRDEQFQPLAGFLSATRDAFLVGAVCGEGRQILVWVQGLQTRPRPGEKDDVLEGFSIKY